MGGHVFISYSHHDRDYVERLRAQLVAAGLPVWTDEGIDYGSRWSDVIESQVETCAAFVVVMSEHSHEAPWVKREIDLAQEVRRPILPLLLAGRRFLQLRDIQDEDVTDGSLPGGRFVQRLRELTGVPEPVAAVPAAAIPMEEPVASASTATTLATDDEGDRVLGGRLVAWDNFTALSVGGPRAVTDIVAVASGLGFDGFQVALNADGTVTQWWQLQSATSVVDGLTDVIAIAAGTQVLALHRDGHVTAWDPAGHSRQPVPDGLIDVVAIAAGLHHNMALQRGGRVVAWAWKKLKFRGLGKTDFGQVSVPADLTNAVAIAAGSRHSLALRGDGSVVAWGHKDHTEWIPELTDVTAIAAARNHSVLLRRNGTIVQGPWKETSSIGSVPRGLTDVVALAAGERHNLALGRDGRVTAWGRASVPKGLANVIAISAGHSQSLAIVRE